MKKKAKRKPRKTAAKKTKMSASAKIDKGTGPEIGPVTKALLPAAGTGREVREVMSEEKIIEAFDMLGITSKLDDRTKKLFVAIARENNLNPLKREIHAVERNQKYFIEENGRRIEKWRTILTPVTGYEVFIDRAEATGRLEYWSCKSIGEIKDETLKSTVIIKRRDWKREFEWTVYYKEVHPPKMEGSVWAKEPHHMTEKVCISRAFRLCFRDILQGMPYTVEESETYQDQREEKQAIAEPEELVIPEEKPTDFNTADAVDAEIVGEAQDIVKVRAECSALRRDMAHSKLFTTAELNECTDQFTRHGDDIVKLRADYSAWFDVLTMKRKEKKNA